MLPSAIGRYQIEGVLGRGGMGIVYAAYDPELERPVALKVMRPSGRDPVLRAETRARLLREARAVGGLSHPHVVEVYAFGEVDGDDAVYLAMERLDGGSLRTWFTRGPHPWKDVVAIMLEAGRGLAAAHESGIVHRDFKPANVLLGADGRARVLDFGLARSGTYDELPSETSGPADPEAAPTAHIASGPELPALTEAGSVMGTPAYMAPEQAQGAATDARADQFSFCVALFEALYGLRPFEGTTRAARLNNARKGRIRDRPSDRRVPASIDRWIVRGLDPDPNRRWPALQDLLQQLERVIEPPKGRMVLLLGGAALGLAAFVGWPRDPCVDVGAQIDEVWNESSRGTARGAFLATDVAHAAETWDRTAPMIDAFADAWTQAREESCRASESDPSRGHDSRAICLDERKAELSTLMDVFARADATVVGRAVESTAELGAIETCAIDDGVLEPPVSVAPRVHEVRRSIAGVKVLRDTGRYDQALEAGQAAIVAAEETGFGPVKAEVFYHHGRTQEALGRYRDAAWSYEQGYLVATESGHDLMAASASTSLYFVYGYRLSEAEQEARWHRHAVAASTRLGDAGASRRAELTRIEGNVALRRSDFDAARAAYSSAVEQTTALGDAEALDIAEVTGDLGLAQFELGMLDEAEANFARALEIAEGKLGPLHPRVAVYLNNSANLLQMRGEHERALEYFQRSFNIDAAIFGEDHPNVAMALNNIGTSLTLLERDEEAAAYFKRSIVAYESGEYDAIEFARPIGNLGYLHGKLGRKREGVEYIQRAIALIEAQEGPGHTELSGLWLNLGSIRLDQGRHDEALAAMQRALDVDEPVIGKDHPYVAQTLASMGGVHLEQERPDQALPLFERALAIQTQHDVDPLFRAASQFGVAQSLWPDPRERERAAKLLTEAQRTFEGLGVRGEDRLAQLRAFVEKHAILPIDRPG